MNGLPGFRPFTDPYIMTLRPTLLFVVGLVYGMGVRTGVAQDSLSRTGSKTS